MIDDAEGIHSMCGFVGIYRPNGNPVAESQLDCLLKTILYRGPDGKGFYQGEGIGLGHVRLAIQDLSPLAGQPMVSRSGRLAIAYNGEIYNVPAIRRRLEQNGVELKSTGDTEAFLEHLDEFGLDSTLETVEGMFAFALWDTREKTLTLARDRHGIKPLYYTRGPEGEVRVASEIKALVTSDSVPDFNTLNATLLDMGASYGDRTVFRGIHEVCPGETVRFDRDGQCEKKSFFKLAEFVDPDLHKELDRMSPKEVVAKLAEAFEESIDLRMLSDAPVACLVSGGIDSCLIAALAKERNPNLKLYHANVVAESELHKAEDLSRELGAELFSVAIKDDDFLDNLPIVTHHYEIPVVRHSSSVPFYMVSKLAARDGIKVVLTGEGSDEYFMGYPVYSIRSQLKAYRKFVGRVQNLFYRFPGRGIAAAVWPRRSADPAEHLRNLAGRFYRPEREEEALEAFRFVANERDRDLHAAALELATGNLGTLLHRNDRLAMAWGLESRFPFLGHSLVKLALNLPNRYKLRRGFKLIDRRHPFIIDKWCVRKLCERHFSDAIAYRRKFAFHASTHRRMRPDPKYFHDGFVADWFGLSEKGIEQLVKRSPVNWVARLVLMEIWGKLFVLRRSTDETRDELRRHVSLPTRVREPGWGR